MQALKNVCPISELKRSLSTGEWTAGPSLTEPKFDVFMGLMPNLMEEDDLEHFVPGILGFGLFQGEIFYPDEEEWRTYLSLDTNSWFE